MDIDDSFDEMARVATTGAAALSRAAEVLLRKAQDTKMRQASETARVTEDFQRRVEAQAGAAERYYARAGEPEWVRRAGVEDVALAWQGAQQWAQLDPARFAGHAERITTAVRQEFGIDLHDPEQRGRLRLDNTRTLTGEPARDDPAARVVETPLTTTQSEQAEQSVGYDTVERRASTDARLEAAGVSPRAREARMLADQLNGHNPAEIHARATKAATVGSSMAKAKARTGRVPERDPGRGR